MTRRIMDAEPLAKWRIAEMYSENVRTDDEIRVILRNRSDTVYHPVGTARMGADEAAVVDPQLRVIGVEGLRVADASIMPTLIGGNTNAPSIMIGEKAADMIRKRAGVWRSESVPDHADLRKGVLLRIDVRWTSTNRHSQVHGFSKRRRLASSFPLISWPGSTHRLCVGDVCALPVWPPHLDNSFRNINSPASIV